MSNLCILQKVGMQVVLEVVVVVTEDREREEGE